MIFGTAQSGFGSSMIQELVKGMKLPAGPQRDAYFRARGYKQDSKGNWHKSGGLYKAAGKVSSGVKAVAKSPLVRTVAKVAAAEAISKFAPPGTKALVTSAAGRVTSKLGPTATKILKPAAAQAARQAFTPAQRAFVPTPSAPQPMAPMQTPYPQPVMYQQEYPQEYPQDSLSPMQQELEERGFDVERVPAEEEMAGFGAAGRGGLGLVLGVGAAVGVSLFFVLRR